MNKIEIIGNQLRDLIGDRKIIARCELLNRIYQFVRQANLDEAESEEISKLVGKHIAPGIFTNVLSGDPIFNDLPKLDTYTQINGRIFHFFHAQKYSKEDFDNAYRRFLSSKNDLRSLLQENLEYLLSNFISEAGYNLDGREKQVLKFSAPGRAVRAKVYTSIRSLNLEDCNQYLGLGPDGSDCVLLVPSAENLEPFVQFFRERGAEIEEAGVQVWVANIEQGTIDPFIGYTTDMDIYNQFKNPRLAANVRSTWGRSDSSPRE